MAEQQSIPETGVHWPLTGRRALMAELVDAIEGNNGAVLLAGDAGVGKSRLLEELGQQLIGEGRKVVRCSATAGTRQIPFALFAPVLEPEALVRIYRGAQLAISAATETYDRMLAELRSLEVQS